MRDDRNKVKQYYSDEFYTESDPRNNFIPSDSVESHTYSYDKGFVDGMKIAIDYIENENFRLLIKKSIDTKTESMRLMVKDYSNKGVF